jgi:DNA polymerase V
MSGEQEAVLTAQQPTQTDGHPPGTFFSVRRMFSKCSDRPTRVWVSVSRESMLPLTLHELPFDIVPSEARLLVETTPAGFPSPAQDDMEEPIDLASWLIDHPAASYVMRVAGHSMVDAGIADGDLVVVSRAVEARPGDIVVALVDGSRTMKRLRRSAGRLWLVPEAEGYDRIIVDETVEVWGVVVALARRYRR